MSAIQFNNLFFYFLCSQLLFLPIYFYESPLISYTVSTNKALLMHVIGIFWSGVGYLTLRFASSLQKMPTESKRYIFKSTFFICSYLFIIVGTIVSMLQVILFISPIEYLSNILGGNFEAGIRDAFLLSSDEGGLPGIIKMLGYSSLSVYLMSLGLQHFVTMSPVDRGRMKYLSRVALALVLVKVFFSLDRLSIMAVLSANFFLGIQKGHLKKIRYWILIAVCFLIADYVSAKRLETYGIIDFTLLYLKLGLVNYQLMIDTASQYTYGFSTFLAPFYFILKFLNLPVSDFESSYDWEWNPAQYFSSYAFQDFGYFYFVLFYFVGVILCFIDLKALKQSNINGIAIYFVVLYGVISFIFVPVIRGMDFWFSLLLPLFLINSFTKRINIPSNPSMDYGHHRRRLITSLP